MEFKGIADVESPYDGPDDDTIRRNVLYARAACKHALGMGYAPYASHLFFTQPGILDDKVPAERELGMEAGKALIRESAAFSLFYLDLGMSGGMRWGKEDARRHGRAIEEFRLLDTTEGDDGGGWSFAELLARLQDAGLIGADYGRMGW